MFFMNPINHFNTLTFFYKTSCEEPSDVQRVEIILGRAIFECRKQEPVTDGESRLLMRRIDKGKEPGSFNYNLTKLPLERFKDIAVKITYSSGITVQEPIAMPSLLIDRHSYRLIIQDSTPLLRAKVSIIDQSLVSRANDLPCLMQKMESALLPLMAEHLKVFMKTNHQIPFVMKAAIHGMSLNPALLAKEAICFVLQIMPDEIFQNLLARKDLYDFPLQTLCEVLGSTWICSIFYRNIELQFEITLEDQKQEYQDFVTDQIKAFYAVKIQRGDNPSDLF